MAGNTRTTARFGAFAVATAVLGFGFLAWYHIRTTTIWYDETITLLTVAGHAHPDWAMGFRQFEGSASFARILMDLYRFDVHPPLYFWTVAVWRDLTGHSIESIRFLSALFIAATIWLLYRVGALLPMRWPAVPALIYSVSGAAAGYAYTARSYAMAEFLIVLTIYCAHRKSAWTGITAGLCIAVHYFSALCVGPILLVYCAARWNTERRWSLLTAGCFTGTVSLLAPLLLVHFRARPDQYTETASLVHDLAAGLSGTFSTGFPDSRLVLVRGVTAAFAALYVLAGAIYSVRQGIRFPAIALTTFLTGFFVLSTVTHKPIANMPVAYYFGFIAPVLALLAGFGVEALPRTAPVLAGLIVVSMTAARPIVHPIFADYRGLLTAVRTSLRADDVIVVGAGFGRGVPGSVVYEAGGREILVLNRQSIDSIVDRAGKAGSVYFIPSLEAVTALVEREFIERLHLQPGAGYYESSMVPRTISLRGAPCRRGR